MSGWLGEGSLPVGSRGKAQVGFAGRSPQKLKKNVLYNINGGLSVWINSYVITKVGLGQNWGPVPPSPGLRR